MSLGLALGIAQSEDGREVFILACSCGWSTQQVSFERFERLVTAHRGLVHDTHGNLTIKPEPEPAPQAPPQPTQSAWSIAHEPDWDALQAQIDAAQMPPYDESGWLQPYDEDERQWSATWTGEQEAAAPGEQEPGAAVPSPPPEQPAEAASDSVPTAAPAEPAPLPSWRQRLQARARQQ